MADSLSPALPPFPETEGVGSWGGLQYLANISLIGGLTCILLFLFIKLRDDHKLPHPVHLISKLVAVWYTTDDQITRLCGADASDYLTFLRLNFCTLGALSIPGLCFILPINIFSGNIPIPDELVAATVSHLETGSSWFWLHAAFVIVVAFSVHKGLDQLDQHLHESRYREYDAVDTIAVYTLMIRGVPRGLARDKQLLVEYFEHLYPGKIFRVCVPQDLVSYISSQESLRAYKERMVIARQRAAEESETEMWRRRAEEIAEASFAAVPRRGDADFYQPLAGGIGDDEGLVLSDDEDELLGVRQAVGQEAFFPQMVSRTVRQVRKFGSRAAWRKLWRSTFSRGRSIRFRYLWCVGFWDWREEVLWIEERISALELLGREFQEGRGRGAGIAFVVFKDVFTATRALRDAAWKVPRWQQVYLATARWRAERAPPPAKVHWHHVGSSAWGRCSRSWGVNLAVFFVLLFWSSPLAMLTAVNSASERLEPDIVSHFHSWLAWAKGSSWLSAIIYQFLPNALLFFAMYTIIPAALSRLAKLERHVTLSGEQQAVLAKMVFFFLINLFLLKATVETTLESAILHFGRCYSNPHGCITGDRWFSQTFVGSSSLSALAFLITSSSLGVSLDLLSPFSFLKRQLRRYKERRSEHVSDSGGMGRSNEGSQQHGHLLGTPAELSETPGSVGKNLGGALERGLYEEEEEEGDGLVETAAPPFAEQDMAEYPLAETTSLPQKPVQDARFDFAQYYSYNLTTFAMTLMYSVTAPLVLPAGTFFFFYRYLVDKYNFLFTYRVAASPASATDGKLIRTVSRIMRMFLCAFAAVMCLFFWVRGDRDGLQMLITAALFVCLVAKYGVDKAFGSFQDRSLDGFFVQGLGSVERLVRNGVVGYEVSPNCPPPLGLQSR